VNVRPSIVAQRPSRADRHRLVHLKKEAAHADVRICTDTAWRNPADWPAGMTYRGARRRSSMDSISPRLPEFWNGAVLQASRQIREELCLPKKRLNSGFG
jgi:hypothetical protein